MSWTFSSWPTSPYLSLECSHLLEKPERGANHCPLCSADYKSKAIIQLRCFDTTLDSPPSLSEASHFQIFNPAASNLTDSPLFQVEHIYLPGPTDWDGGADRLTPGIWRKIQNKVTIVHDISCLQIPDAWVGKGISHESLPHAETQDRDGSPAVSHRETNQNLVPEQVRCSFTSMPFLPSPFI